MPWEVCRKWGPHRVEAVEGVQSSGAKQAFERKSFAVAFPGDSEISWLALADLRGRQGSTKASLSPRERKQQYLRTRVDQWLQSRPSTPHPHLVTQSLSPKLLERRKWT